MALFNFRVLTSVTRRSFFLDHGVAMGPIITKAKKVGEIEAEAEVTHQQVNQKYDDTFGKVQTQTKKKKVDKVECDDKICHIKTWK